MPNSREKLKGHRFCFIGELNGDVNLYNFLIRQYGGSLLWSLNKSVTHVVMGKIDEEIFPFSAKCEALRRYTDNTRMSESEFNDYLNPN